MEDKHLVFLPDDVYKELKKIGKEFNSGEWSHAIDADDPETIAKTIAILIYSFKLSTRFWEDF